MTEVPAPPVTFDLAGGSIIGTEHRAVPKNNQDAWQIMRESNGTEVVAVVCDGCGSGAHSEVGAQVGVRLICASVLREMAVHSGHVYWERVERDVLSAIHVLASQMGDNYRKVIEDHFLFTIMGVAITDGTIIFFGVGDGLYIVDGLVNWGGSWPGNAPPYLAYQLLEGREIGVGSDDLRLQTMESAPVATVDSFLIGCDGAADPGLLAVCRDGRTFPGMGREVGPISQFWQDDAIFRNPDTLRRRLKMIARDWPQRNPQHGLLPDDTTIIVGRKT